ncbi:hypothetical protein [uncultured Jannaschia sp.]|uniref:hypothetical protein n=1 Tax=uncultured Jannaschia sp. TaxID=293347 RepID=UPI00260AE57F|nr:hypothetical protein [uncultured Jannaschia sp.]
MQLNRFGLASTAVVFLAAVAPAAAQEQVIVTGHGVFIGCQDARAYRNGPLLDMLDGAFAAYDPQLEERLAAVISEFQRYEAEANAAMAAAGEEQTRRIIVTAAKWAALTIMDLGLDNLPDEFLDGYTNAQIETFKAVVSTSNSMKGTVGEAIATGEGPSNFLSDQAASTMLGILGSRLGPIGTIAVNVAQGKIEVVAEYMDSQLDIDFSKAEADQFADSLQRLNAKSQSQKIDEINAVKTQIDVACAT